MIDGVCYENGEFNPSSDREYCNPSVSVSVWTTANGEFDMINLIDPSVQLLYDIHSIKIRLTFDAPNE